MDLLWVELTISLITGFASFLVTYGVMKNKQETSDKRIDWLEDRVEEIKSSYVTLAQFNSTVQMLHSDQVEMRNDIKRILEIVSKRNG